MTLTRHTQVENLANLLAARRRQEVARASRDEAYRHLVGTILDVPADAVGSRPASPIVAQPLAASLRIAA